MMGGIRLFVLIYYRYELFYSMISLLINSIDYVLSFLRPLFDDELLIIIILIGKVVLCNPLFDASNDRTNENK